ncbi:methionine aminopeptidase 2-like [Cucurbita maxima]|uniref:Methionine aminopeptidase 2-like n=1 Tax=Cucurbita maxima TaxID=3661 RepID=A0A6J1IQL3_CUCMA|nr:methionine aminopeptidase 2-like [Cucurbita maxima]
MSRTPTMATVTAALERSLQNCSLSHRQATPPVPSDSHGGSSTHHLHLNSHLSLPYHWEQCLDLKTGEIYYINWRNGMKAKEDPRFTTEDDQYSDDYYCYSDDDDDNDDDDDDSSYDSEESSTESSNNKNKNKNMEEQQEEDVLVVAGCKRCLMYFMVPKHLEECPKCSSGELLYFDRSENDIP